MDDYIHIQEIDSSSSRGSKWGERALNSVNRYLKYFKGRILEVGCNDGYVMEYLVEKGFQVTGIDIAKEKLKIANEHNLKAVFAFQENIPYPDKSFDTLFSSHTLEHSYDREKAANEYQRVAKRAIIIVPIEEGHKPTKTHVSLFENKDEFINLFKNRGKILVSESLHRLQSEYAIVIDFYETKN